MRRRHLLAALPAAAIAPRADTTINVGPNLLDRQVLTDRAFKVRTPHLSGQAHDVEPGRRRDPFGQDCLSDGEVAHEVEPVLNRGLLLVHEVCDGTN